MKITSFVFEAYLKCPTKCWLLATGESARGNVYADWVKAQNASYRATETARLLATFPHDKVLFSPNVEDFKTTPWRVASSVAVQTKLNSFALESDLHVVEYVPAGGCANIPQFIPIRLIPTNKLCSHDKLQLNYDAFVLGKALNCETSVGKIIHGENHSTLTVKTSLLDGEIRRSLLEMIALISSPTPPELVLNRHCPECEFQTHCRRKGMEKDDLSLLAGMSAKERQKLRSKGIFTVTQLSYTFRPRRTPKRTKNPARPRYFALQALALRENTVYIHGTPTHPQSKIQVYFDIEGIPDRDFNYLIGALVVSGEHETFHSFWADTLADETTAFVHFIDTISRLEDFCAFHFGDYDASVLRRVRNRLPQVHQKQLDIILGNCSNTLSTLYPHVYFPTYSNGLKDIGNHLVDNSTAHRATGLESIIWRGEWEKGSDGDWKSRIIEYNRADCLILRVLVEFVAGQIASEIPNATRNTKVSRTEDLNSTHPRWRMFSRPDYVLEDFEYITKCSYFDYQREKVLVRTDSHLRKVNKKRRGLQPTKLRSNEIIELAVKKCVACKSKSITINWSSEHWLVDLRFSESGVKRWTTQTRFHRYHCLKCGSRLSTWDGERRRAKYGHSLVSWCVYWHVIGGMNMRRVNRSLGDFFGLVIPYCASHRFKADMRAGYDPLCAEILNALLHSPILHIDETRVNLRGTTGYVWVLSSADLVYFFYRPSREGDFLEEMLRPFKGILISDFFTAYDSLPCRQQKCLAHLIRDIDEDLFRNPLDHELRTMAQDFGRMLKTIVNTIDRFGLKRRNLQKHRREVSRFLEVVEKANYNSELANRFKKRFERSGAKMFAFLDHDGVPWNNNNAEHAIKFFAKFRQNADGRFTEKSLRDYLVLASVFATCEFNNLNSLDFLLSKESTLSGFFRMTGRKIAS